MTISASPSGKQQGRLTYLDTVGWRQKKEKCMTHYLKNINFKERTECLKCADVVLYAQMYE
jgi:hypothetical protein